MGAALVEGVGRVVVIRDGVPSLSVVGDGQAGAFIKVRESLYPDYEGETTVTPTRATQTLSTTDKAVHDDITVNPIPSNYGLLTQDGDTLTIT